MAYQRKTDDVYVLQGRYSDESGWDDILSEDTHKAAKAQLRAYAENEHIPLRIVKKRVKKEVLL